LQISPRPVHARAFFGARLRSRQAIVAAVVALTGSTAAAAADIKARAEGIQTPFGQIGCALFPKPAAAGFPMDNSVAVVQWLAAEAKGVTCRFTEVVAGVYAIGVSHDVNGNRKLDTNFVGIPVEQWGVSNNVRPKLRAPRFDEAAFRVSDESKEIELDIKVAK